MASCMYEPHLLIIIEWHMIYDKYYQTENLFGEPYPALIEFFAHYPAKGKLLDLGCGQGRDAIALARLGYTVTGIDRSKVGIEQMNRVAKVEKLTLVGKVGDIYAFDHYAEFDFILLDSMFHFTKKNRDKEVGFLRSIISRIKKDGLIVICIQDAGNKVHTLKQALNVVQLSEVLVDQKFNYTFKDEGSGHQSKSDYRMIIVKKLLA